MASLTPQQLAKLFPDLASFEKIGEGGTGAVYRVHSLDLGLDVAFKTTTLPVPGFRDEEFRARFQREFDILFRASDNPHLVRVLRMGEKALTTGLDSALLWYTMELCSGNLKVRLCSLTLPHRIEIVGQFLDTLCWLEAMRIAHRDLKPANIFLSWSRGRPHIRLGDFGLACGVRRGDHLDKTLTEEGMVRGTLDYLAPEYHRFEREVDELRADQWAAGVVIHEVLSAGRRPFEPPAKAMTKVLPFVALGQAKHAPPQPLVVPGFEGSIGLVRHQIARMLDADPAERFPSMKECKLALQTAFLQSGMLSTA